MLENQAFQRIPNVCRIARVAWQRSNPWHQLGAKELLTPTSYFISTEEIDMISNNIKIPQIISFIMSGIAAAISSALIASPGLVYKNFLLKSEIQDLKSPALPLIYYQQIYVLCILFLFLLVILKYKGQSRRAVSILFILLLCAPKVFGPFLQIIYQRKLALSGAVYLAAYSSMTSAITLCTFLFTLTADVLFFISAGRYGISRSVPDCSEENIQQSL